MPNGIIEDGAESFANFLIWLIAPSSAVIGLIILTAFLKSTGHNLIGGLTEFILSIIAYVTDFTLNLFLRIFVAVPLLVIFIFMILAAFGIKFNKS